jgi:hypothetical protein
MSCHWHQVRKSGKGRTCGFALPINSVSDYRFFPSRKLSKRLNRISSSMQLSISVHDEQSCLMIGAIGILLENRHGDRDNHWNEYQCSTCNRQGHTEHFCPDQDDEFECEDSNASNDDHINVPYTNVQLTQRELDECWERRPCFACRHPGHIARFCPYREDEPENGNDDHYNNCHHHESDLSYESCESDSIPSGASSSYDPDEVMYHDSGVEMTRRDFERHWNQGLCFVCHQPGYIARDCHRREDSEGTDNYESEDNYDSYKYSSDSDNEYRMRETYDQEPYGSEPSSEDELVDVPYADSPLTQQELDDCWLERICFNCCRPGHLARFCPERDDADCTDDTCNNDEDVYHAADVDDVPEVYESDSGGSDNPDEVLYHQSGVQMTRREFDDHWNRFLCFASHRPGHIARDCPEDNEPESPYSDAYDKYETDNDGVYLTLNSICYDFEGSLVRVTHYEGIDTHSLAPQNWVDLLELTHSAKNRPEGETGVVDDELDSLPDLEIRPEILRDGLAKNVFHDRGCNK